MSQWVTHLTPLLNHTSNSNTNNYYEAEATPISDTSNSNINNYYEPAPTHQRDTYATVNSK